MGNIISRTVVRRRLSEVLPFLLPVRIEQLRWQRRLLDLLRQSSFGRPEIRRLAVRLYSHRSLLRRKLGNSDPQLQENKVVNLKLAAPTIDGMVLRPGQTFSFWRCIGPPVARRGYIEGVQLSQGEVKRGVGGGLCQMANLLYWMALHSPLVVVERHHHSFDPFPDFERVLPFGSGAGVFYNYVDLRFRNPTRQSWQLRVQVGEQHLEGELLTDRPWPYSYHVYEQNHRFTRRGEQVYRSNEIWRKTTDRATGDRVRDEMLIRNFSLVKYPVAEELLSPAE